MEIIDKKVISGVAENNAYRWEDDFIYLGEWPQSLKSDKVTVGTEADSDGYFLGDDGERYARVVATKTPIKDGSYASSKWSSPCFENGTKIRKGSAYYFKVEPVRWRILKMDKNGSFLFCDKVIDGAVYNDKKGNRYDESSLRQWLCGEFYQKAFDDAAKSVITLTHVDNKKTSTGSYRNPNACPDTDDFVFLLSYKEMGQKKLNLGESDLQVRYPTDYARAKGVWMAEEDASSHYWLRSPGDMNDEFAITCNNSGLPYYCCGTPAGQVHGVVPAVNIKTDPAETRQRKNAVNNTRTFEPSGAQPVVKDDYVMFGAWPQTLKDESVTVSDTTDENDCFTGSDGEKYICVKATPRGDGSYNKKAARFHTGAEIVKDQEYYFKIEPIKWRILGRADVRMFLISEQVLLSLEFNRSDDHPNNYEKSFMRQWLNGDFLRDAFNEESRKRIVTTAVDNSPESTGRKKNRYACPDTVDKIFLLSNAEAARPYAWGKKGLVKTATDFANAVGCDSDGYLSRSPFYGESMSVGWICNGEVMYNFTDWIYTGVAPCLQIACPPHEAGDTPLPVPAVVDAGAQASPADVFRRDGDYVYLGTFPQSKKSAEVTISGSADAMGCFTGSDGEKYMQYFDDSSDYYKVEPIKWRILKEEKGEALLCCENIIAGMLFDPNCCNQYEGSEMYWWLAEDFIMQAFGDESASRIVTTSVDNSARSTGIKDNPNAGGRTKGQAFLPSCKEIADKSLFPDGESLKRKPTDYACASGLCPENGTGSYWLRSPGSNEQTSTVFFVDSDGDIDLDSADCLHGVVPMMKIRL